MADSINEDRIQDLQSLLEDDIQSLLELSFTQGPVKVRHVRQASVIVRRWLCDNELGKLTRHFRVSVTFPVLSDEHVLKLVESDSEVDYYISAGVKFNGQPIFALYHSNSNDPPEWAVQLAKIGSHDVNLSKALAKTVLYYGGERFSMAEVLRFACNKLGGAHLDDQRDDRQVVLEKASRYVTFGGPEQNLRSGQPGVIHLPLEPEGTEVLSGVMVVVIAAAAMLVNIRFNGIPLTVFRIDRPTLWQRSRALFQALIRGYRRATLDCGPLRVARGGQSG